MIDYLRDHKTEFGLVSANGGILSKQSMGIYSRIRPEHDVLTDVDLTQSGNGAQTALMKFYTDNYDVDVTQSGSTSQSYSATFNCSSNCNKTISITQQ